MAAIVMTRSKPVEDAMAHLPKSSVVEYRKGQVIYSGGQPSNRIYFIIQGEVLVSRWASEGSPVVVGIYQSNEIFGEAALVNSASKCEQAVALENTKLMSWPATEITDAIVKQPRLGVVLMQGVAQRESELRWRIESLALDTILRRVARSLIRLSDRLGTPQEDGWIRMSPLTHKVISQYVGSTREIVTHHMTEFRRLGYVNYSREAILVNRGALEGWLKQNTQSQSASMG